MQNTSSSLFHRFLSTPLRSALKSNCSEKFNKILRTTPVTSLYLVKLSAAGPKWTKKNSDTIISLWFSEFFQSSFFSKCQKQPPEVFYKNSCFLKNLAIIAGKHPCWRFFFNKKRDFNTGVFLRILQNFQEHLF